MKVAVVIYKKFQLADFLACNEVLSKFG